MANLMVDFVQGFASSLTPESLSELKSGADTIKDTLMGGARTAQDKYREIRNSSAFKKTTDFFFRRSSDFETGSTLEDSDDDFDAGFNFGGDDQSSKKNQTSLDYESMRNIVKGQVSSMYQIAGKQAEASAMTTSEIITTLNTRTSEILSSLNSVNSSLQGISGKLDQIIKIQTGKEERNRGSRASIMDENGNITLSSLFNVAKENIAPQLSMLNSFKEGIGMLLGMEGSKSSKLGSIAGLSLGLFEDKKFGVLGERSINEIRAAIDDRVYSAQNNLLSKLLNWDKFKKLFGDLTKREANKDYGAYIDNKYDRKKAIFDNMTRKSIVEIIPGYLRKITAALTGQNFFISSDGSLTTEKPNGFANVFTNTIQSGFNSRRIDAMMESADKDIDKHDVEMAQRVLTSLYVFQALRKGIKVNSGADFADGGDPAINSRAVDILASHGVKKPISYWEKVISLLTSQLIADKRARDNFAKIVRTTADDTDKRAIRYAEDATTTLDIGNITDEIVNTVVGSHVDRSSGKDDRTYDERIKAGEMKESDMPVGAKRTDRPSDQALEKARRERIKQAELVGNIGRSFQEISSTTTDYVASIFHLLNRGINVYSVQQDGPFERMGLVKAGSSTTSPTLNNMLKEVASTATKASGKYKIAGRSKYSQKLTTEQEQAVEAVADAAAKGDPDLIDKAVTKLNDTFKDQITWMKNTGNSISEKAKAESKGIQADYENIKNEATIKVNRELAMGQLRNDDTISDHDKSIADSVLAAMQASVSDGETAEDLGPLMDEVSKIENPKLKSRLSNVVQGTMKRSEVKKPAQSKIGKILLWGFGLAKKFIGGIVSKAKTFITGIGKKFLGPLFKSLGKDWQGIKQGARSIKEGFFGSDESVGLFGRMKRNKDQPTEKNGYTTEWVDSGIQGPTIQQAPKGQYDAYSKDIQEIKTQVKKNNDDNKSWFAKMAEGLKNSPIGQGFSKMTDWFKGTDFGAGFMSAFEKKKDMKPETVADKSSQNIEGMLKDKTGSGTVFGTIIDAVTGIGKKIEETTSRLLGTPANSGDVKSTTGTNPDGTASDTSNYNAFSGGGETQQSDGGEAPAVNVGTTGGDSTKSGGGDSGGKKRGIGFDFGKILGGISGIGMRIVSAIVKIVTSLKAFKAMMSMFNKSLTTILKPLNKMFKALNKALKPVLKTITKVLTQIVNYIVDIVKSVIEIIQPILESIGPLIEQIFKVLEPLLKIITSVVDKILAPIMGILNAIIVPVVKTIASTLEIISGVVEVGFGLVLTVLGGVYTVVGGILKFLTFGFASSQYNMGKQMMKTGTELVKDGSSKLKSGLTSLGNVFSTDTVVDAYNEGVDAYRGKDRGREELPIGSPMDGVYGSGDATLDSIYGGYGVNQGRYGNFMNMTARGCGPVALADAYARRSGGSISATGLTSAMASSGTYSPSMGTSVSGFMNTASSMGMHLTPGGVTPASLKQASPSNPITIIGSGADFSTRGGNNHYMNVVGSSGSTAFVSNPLSGRIERRPISGLASSSVMGLYGSGDVPKLNSYQNVYGNGDVTQAFGEAIQESLTALKDLVGGIISLFTGEGDDVEDAVNREKSQSEYQQAMQNLGLSGLEEAESKYKDAVFKKNEKGVSIIGALNPRYSNESDGDYEKRLNAEYEKNKVKYLAAAMNQDLKEKAKLAAGDGEGTLGNIMNNTVGEEFVNSMDEMYQAVENAGTLEDMMAKYSNGGERIEDYVYEAGFYSDNGARLYTDNYTPSVFDTSDAVNWRNGAGDNPNIPLLEWFKYNMPEMKGMSGAYKRYGPPADSNVEGLAGSDHLGTDIYGPEGTPIIAPTNGHIIANYPADKSGGGGNMLYLLDEGNDVHVFMHMKNQSPLPVGTQVFGGETILGYVGSTGNSTGPHLHYQIQNVNGSDAVVYNPHTFFKWYDAADSSGSGGYGPIDYGGSLSDGDVWDLYKDKPGALEFIKLALSAGLTGPELATITSTGIWEDGAKKLFGTKSLTDVTHDVNGQRAKGIMNWVDTNVDYGDTVEDQLRYIQKTYFSDSSDDWRALVRDTGFDKQDLEAYMKATGRNGWVLKNGERYGPYMNNTDLVEGSEHFFRGALVPAAIHTEEGPRKYIGTAVGVYNWLIQQGFISPGAGRTLTDDITGRWDEVYDQYYNDTGVFYDEEGNNITGDDVSSIAAASVGTSMKYNTLNSTGNDAMNASLIWSDTSSGVPYWYDPKSTDTKGKAIRSNYGKIGVAKNQSGVELFDYVLLPKSAVTSQTIVDSIVAANVAKVILGDKFVPISKAKPPTDSNARKYWLEANPMYKWNGTGLEYNMKYILDPTKLRITIAGGGGGEDMWYQILNYKKSDAGKASKNYIDTGTYTTAASVIAHNKAIAEKAKLLENARFGDTYLDNAYAQAAAAKAQATGGVYEHKYRDIYSYLSNGLSNPYMSEADALEAILKIEKYDPSVTPTHLTSTSFKFENGILYKVRNEYKPPWWSNEVKDVELASSKKVKVVDWVDGKIVLKDTPEDTYYSDLAAKTGSGTYVVNPDVKVNFDSSTTTASPIIDYYEKTGDTSPTVASPLQQVVYPDSYEKTGETTNTSATMSDAALNALYEKAVEDYNKRVVNNVVNPDVNTQFSTSSTTGVDTSKIIPNYEAWDASSYKDWNIPGSGDTQITPSWNKSFASSLGDLFSTDSLADNGTGTVINTYNISKSSDDFMERLTSNTFNVRSEKIENMLNGMLTLMRERRNKSNSAPKRTATTRSRNQNREGIFTDENIPRQIERLSVG